MDPRYLEEAIVETIRARNKKRGTFFDRKTRRARSPPAWVRLKLLVRKRAVLIGKIGRKIPARRRFSIEPLLGRCHHQTLFLADVGG